MTRFGSQVPGDVPVPDQGPLVPPRPEPPERRDRDPNDPIEIDREPFDDDLPEDPLDPVPEPDIDPDEEGPDVEDPTPGVPHPLDA